MSRRHGFDPEPLSSVYESPTPATPTVECPQCSVRLFDLDAHLRWHQRTGRLQ